MKYLLFIITALSIGNNLAYAQLDCSTQDTLNQYEVSADVLRKQNNQIEEVLNGQNTSYIDVNNLIGFTIKPGSESDVIEKLKNAQTKELIPISMQGLVQCLKILKLNEKLEALNQLSKKLNKNKIKLIQSNIDLNYAIQKNIESQKDIPSLKVDLENQKNQSAQLKKEVESQVIEADKEAMQDISLERKELAYYQSSLAKIKIDIINQRLKVIEQLENKITRFEAISKELASISTSFNKSNLQGLKDKLTQVNSIWLEVIKENFKQIFNQEKTYTFTDIPDLPKKSKENESLNDYERIKKFQENLTNLKLETISQIAEKKSHELKIQNSLLIQVNNLRSKIYQEIPTSYIFKQFFSSRYWSIVTSELKASPYRILSFLYEKYLYISEQLASGRPGQKQLVLDSFYLITLFLLLYATHFILVKLLAITDQYLMKFVRIYWKHKLLKLISTAWNKIKKDGIYYLWLIILIFLKDMPILINFSLVIEVASIYLVYKIIVSLVTLFLGYVSKVDFKNFHLFKKKAHLTSTAIGKIYLYYALAMLLIHGAVGKVYFYSLINVFAVVYLVFSLIQKSSAWNSEFLKYLEKNFSGLIVSKLEKSLDHVPSNIRSVLYLISIFILEVFNLLIKLTEHWEISKKISANFFKKQIESLEVDPDQNATIPTEYKNLFTLSSLQDDEQFVNPNEEFVNKLLSEIEDWVWDKSDEHSLVIYGDKGIGKTTLVKHLCNVLTQTKEKAVTSQYLKMPSKTLTINELHIFLGNALNVPAEEEFNLIEIDKKLQSKHIIAIDEVQNIFLSKAGGFQAYYELINLVNLPTENIFWLLSFNKYSWIFLDRAFERNLFFRNIFELKGWNDIKIKELIMNRHRKSQFQLSYDLLISATKSDEEMDRYTSVESKFFKLLWELSSGNPRDALYLWPTSLTRKRKNIFNVNVPMLVDSNNIVASSDNLLFVLTSVLKHENITIQEIESTTNLPLGIVRNSLKLALERGYLYKDGRERYMIEISSQHGIIKYLKTKNFIYGN